MATVFLPLEEPIRHQPHGRRWALWDLGFRPFYLLAALLALSSVPLWALQFSGMLGTAYLRGPAWHAHEMVFGYALAVIVGFLFTAGRNWSGRPTPTGRPLMGLALLWLAARMAVLTPFGAAAGLLNVAVPWLAAWGLWRALHAGGNRRNYFFVALLVMMGVAAGVFHLGQSGWLTLPGGLGLPLALDVVLLMIAVMAGRVVPMFSNNGVPGLQARRDERIERSALATVLVIMAFDVLGVTGPALAAALAAAALVHGWRLALWQPWKTLHNPLVWVLHAACAWLPVHLLLRAGAVLGWWAAGPATHALTVGVIGMVTLGMITRTALGHTGRALRAGPYERLAYLAVLGAALVRVLVPLAWPAALVPSALLSSGLWLLAFALYLWHYTPMLLRPRADGQPG
jgi:uncharacterized protein involved in response to NO